MRALDLGCKACGLRGLELLTVFVEAAKQANVIPSFWKV